MTKKLPAPILLYLLSLEMLPLLDETNASNSLKKSVRTIEAFASNSFKEIEQHQEIAKYVHECLVPEFSKVIDSIEIV